MARAESKAEKCVAWAISKGAKVSGICVAQLSGRGTSLITSSDGDTAREIFIPSSILLTLKNIQDFARSAPAFNEVCQEWSTRVPLTSRRAIILLMAFSQRHSSPWSPYLESLPAYIDSPVFWSENERKLLAGTTVEGVAEDKLAFINAWLSYQQRQEHASAFTKSLKAVELMHYEMLVDSRALLSDEADSCMVPVIDFANHSSIRSTAIKGHQNAVWQTNTAGFTLHVAADTPAAQEVLFSYGRRGLGELLIKYGFIEDCQIETGSRSMTIEIPVGNPVLSAFGEPSFRLTTDGDIEPLSDQESSFIWIFVLQDELDVDWNAHTFQNTAFDKLSILALLQSSASWKGYQFKAYAVALQCLEHQLAILDAAENDQSLQEISRHVNPSRLAIIDAVRDAERRTLQSFITTFSDASSTYVSNTS